MQSDYHLISQKRLDIQRARIDACNTLLDYIHDDIPHSKQQPALALLVSLRSDLESEMEDAFRESLP